MFYSLELIGNPPTTYLGSHSRPFGERLKPSYEHSDRLVPYLSVTRLLGPQALYQVGTARALYYQQALEGRANDKSEEGSFRLASVVELDYKSSGLARLINEPLNRHGDLIRTGGEPGPPAPIGAGKSPKKWISGMGMGIPGALAVPTWYKAWDPTTESLINKHHQGYKNSLTQANTQAIQELDKSDSQLSILKLQSLF
ncbi:hypothetical protein LXL04_002845 [Taraxacum kok-saghyz]